MSTFAWIMLARGHSVTCAIFAWFPCDCHRQIGGAPASGKAKP